MSMAMLGIEQTSGIWVSWVEAGPGMMARRKDGLRANSFPEAMQLVTDAYYELSGEPRPDAPKPSNVVSAQMLAEITRLTGELRRVTADRDEALALLNEHTAPQASPTPKSAPRRGHS